MTASKMEKTYSTMCSSSEDELSMASSSSNRSLPALPDAIGAMESGCPSQEDLTARNCWWKDYLQSGKLFELVACTIFFVFTNALPWQAWVGLTLHERPIPYFVDESGSYIRDLTHNEVFKGDTVPFELLILLSGILPLAIQVFFSCCMCCRSKKLEPCFWSSCLRSVHRTLCVYFTAWSLNMLAVDGVKNYAGYLRPIFYDGCQPNEDYTFCQAESTHGVRKSFPSGHSATAFCGLTLLSLYLHTRFGVYSKRRFVRVYNKEIEESPDMMYEQYETRGSKHYHYIMEYNEQDRSMGRARLISVLSLVPMAVALWIAASRVRDNRHFPADVIGGGLIGSAIAVFTHGLWFV